jgi:hypothetical protein
LSRYLLFFAGIAALLNVARGDEPTGPESKSSTNLPTIAGGGQAPAFKDLAPDKGFLIGLELGLVKNENEEFIKAVRPIYRVGDKEQFGKQFGTHPSHPTIVKAKKGYVVGAITYRSGLNFDGCSLLFMKFENGKLDLTATRANGSATLERRFLAQLAAMACRPWGLPGEEAKRK